MTKLTILWCCAVSYITAWTVYAITDVGKILPATTEPVSWFMPIGICAMLAWPLAFGIEIGRCTRKESNHD